MCQVDEEKPKLAVVANVIFLTGCLSFAILLGLVTASIEDGLSSALEGTHRLLASSRALPIWVFVFVFVCVLGLGLGLG